MAWQCIKEVWSSCTLAVAICASTAVAHRPSSARHSRTIRLAKVDTRSLAELRPTGRRRAGKRVRSSATKLLLVPVRTNVEALNLAYTMEFEHTLFYRLFRSCSVCACSRSLFLGTRDPGSSTL